MAVSNRGHVRAIDRPSSLRVGSWPGICRTTFVPFGPVRSCSVLIKSHLTIPHQATASRQVDLPLQNRWTAAGSALGIAHQTTSLGRRSWKGVEDLLLN
jgi:hypothetical protein